MSNTANIEKIGFVFIGRNEGERLKACIGSLEQCASAKVYVDSGSDDDSVAYAEAHGVAVVHLDISMPFTAARARNAGWRFLVEQNPHIEYVQFLDGDCQLDEHWLNSALAFLEQHQDYAIACGQRKEKKPQASFYNTLCDLEWNTPVGDANACGGDFLIKVAVLHKVAGFRDDFIAGEEPEMCFRIRQAKLKIRRIDQIMTWHDADIHKFGQWWKRTKRCGYAYALGAHTHGQENSEKYKVRETFRSIFWGLALPVIGLISLFFSIIPFLAVLGLYAFRLIKNIKQAPIESGDKVKFACYTLLGKFAEAEGVLSFVKNTVSKKRGTIIEYK